MPSLSFIYYGFLTPQCKGVRVGSPNCRSLLGWSSLWNATISNAPLLQVRKQIHSLMCGPSTLHTIHTRESFCSYACCVFLEAFYHSECILVWSENLRRFYCRALGWERQLGDSLEVSRFSVNWVIGLLCRQLSSGSSDGIRERRVVWHFRRTTGVSTAQRSSAYRHSQQRWPPVPDSPRYSQPSQLVQFRVWFWVSLRCSGGTDS